MAEDIPAIERPAVIGAGLVGASMAAMFACAGLPVRVWDPQPDVESVFRQRLGHASGQLQSLGWAGAGAVRWCASLAEAVEDADWIQECAPESVAVKHELYRRIEAASAPQAILASSTSALTWSELSVALSRPERFVTTHPFNPAHLMPLVEIYGAQEAAALAATAFFRRLGKEVVRLRRDAVGHIANRLASALWREAVHIVAEGIADVGAVDAALVHGPGLRWSVAGAHMSYHLGGGAGGIEHYLAHLGPSQERRWASLGNPSLTPETCSALIEGVQREARGRTVGELEAERDRMLIAALRLRENIALPGPIGDSHEHFAGEDPNTDPASGG